MSLINQMLQDIEQRESRPGAALPPHVSHRQHYGSASGAAPQAAHWGWSGFLALAALAALAGGATAWWLQARPAPATQTAVTAAPVRLAPRPAPPAEATPQQSVRAAGPLLADAPLAQLVPAASAPTLPARAGRESTAPAKPAPPATPPLASPALLPAAPAAARVAIAAGPEKPSSRETGNATATAALARAALPATARAEQLYQQALAEGRQSQPERALKSLREALDSQPGHVLARLALARLLVDNKQGDAAADLLADGLMLLPQQSGFALALAPLWLQSGRQDDAMGLLAQSAKSAGDAPDYHAYYAAQLLQRKRHAEAARHYSIALRSSPGTVDWLIGLGISVQGTGNDKEALEAFKRAFDTGSLTGQKRELVEQMIAGLKARLGL